MDHKNGFSLKTFNINENDENRNEMYNNNE